MYLYFWSLVSFYQVIIKSTFYFLPKSIIDLESGKLFILLLSEMIDKKIRSNTTVLKWEDSFTMKMKWSC